MQVTSMLSAGYLQPSSSARSMASARKLQQTRQDAQAAQHGTKLVVGLNSDSSVRRLKGEARPVNDWQARAEVLASMQNVDIVVGFDDDTPKSLIEATRPDFLIKGGDYKAGDVVGYDFVKSVGGETVIIPFVDGYSTTNTISKMNE